MMIITILIEHDDVDCTKSRYNEWNICFVFL